MKKSAILSVLVLGLVGALAAIPTFADDVLYDNTNSTIIGDYNIYNFATTDSFTLSSSSVVTGANFEVWINGQYPLLTVDWAITTSPFGGITEDSGTASPIGSILIPGNAMSAPLYEESFSIPSLSLAAGTYWFQLNDAVTQADERVGWNRSDGPSAAYENAYGIYSIPSEQFQILGEEEPVVPEPSSFLLLGSGLAGLVGVIKRKLMA